MTVREFLNNATNDEVAGLLTNIYGTAFQDDAGMKLENFQALVFFETTVNFLESEIKMDSIIAIQKTAATNRAFITFAKMKDNGNE